MFGKGVTGKLCLLDDDADDDDDADADDDDNDDGVPLESIAGSHDSIPLSWWSSEGSIVVGLCRMFVWVSSE